MKVSYKMAREIKEIVKIILNEENKKMFILLDGLKHKCKKG